MSYLITPAVGAVYKFKFAEDYQYWNGVYKVVQILSYDEYLDNGRTLIDDFYTACGLDEARLVADLPSIRASSVLKLTAPDDTSDQKECYAPLCFVNEAPDSNVKKYYKMGMICTIGVTEGPDDLEFAKQSFVEVIEASLGVTPDPVFVTLNNGEWMTQDEYNQILAERDASKKKVINYFSQCKKLEQEVASLKTKLAAYEKVIIEQHQELQATESDGG